MKSTTVLVLLSLVFGLLLCETILRASGYLRSRYLVPDRPFFVVDPDPRIGYSLKPGYRGNPTFFDFRQREYRFPRVDYTVNTQGFRGPEWLPLDEGVFRIAVVGDSMAFGLGVEEGEAFPRILERDLNGWAVEKGIERRFRVYNLGVPGYNLEQEYFTWSRWGKILKPQMVIHVVYINDCEAQLHYALGTIVREFGQRFPSHLLFLANVLRTNIRSSPPGIREGTDLEACQDYLKQFGEGAKAIGADYWGFVLVPVQYLKTLQGTDKEKIGRLNAFRRSMEGAFTASGGQAQDVIEVLLGYPPYQFLIDPQDDHFNAKGHVVIADALKRKVIENYAATWRESGQKS
ncbi:MAG: SGNH/GDSL hydrolase family protein [Deltaproteobacteria bacterium]|nr:SGNH/GDSL hydrolase family protein [Deltaproteobacteria bacterium]